MNFVMVGSPPKQQLLKDVLRDLLLFKFAQEALKGGKYVTLSLLSLLTHQIREAQIGFRCAICEGN